MKSHSSLMTSAYHISSSHLSTSKAPFELVFQHFPKNNGSYN